MLRRLPLVLVPALVLAVVDLAVKAIVRTHALDFHQRSHGWSLVMLALLAVVLLLVVLPSRLVAVAAGIVAGGALGNLVSAARHDGRVPNPLVVGTIAFNLADIFVLVGIPLFVVALVRVTIGHRERIDRLIPPRRWELALRRRLGL